MKYSKNILQYSFGIYLFLSVTGCKKLIAIDPPTNTITTSEAFADSVDAAAGVAGIYSKMISADGLLFGGNAVTIFTGLSSDELISFNSDPDYMQFQLNQLLPSNGFVGSFFWTQPYAIIYQTNACIAALQNSTGIKQSAKDQFIGEAKFMRAFIYFYLVNIMGDVPYITSIDYNQTAVASRSARADVYNDIVKDLQDAQKLLRADFDFSAGERVRATKWAATALLARVYLYNKKYTEAASAASEVIGSPLFSLNNDLNSVFLMNNEEAILQWQLNPIAGSYNATPEGDVFIPYDHTSNPNFYLTPQLLDSFETGDARRLAWVDSTNYDGTDYFYPNKYKIGYAKREKGGALSEYYMVLRLAEQYLIRAEAKAMLGDVAGAQIDIDAVRNRAGLDNTTAANQASLLQAVAQERKVELFCEWGHRWLDLSRTQMANSILSKIKPGFTINDQLYPIPAAELQNDPNLTQNPGYN